MTCRGLHHHQKANLGPKPMLLVLEHIVLTSLLFYLSHPNDVSQQEDLGHRVLLQPSFLTKIPLFSADAEISDVGESVFYPPLEHKPLSTWEEAFSLGVICICQIRVDREQI